MNRHTGRRKRKRGRTEAEEGQRLNSDQSQKHYHHLERIVSIWWNSSVASIVLVLSSPVCLSSPFPLTRPRPNASCSCTTYVCECASQLACSSFEALCIYVSSSLCCLLLPRLQHTGNIPKNAAGVIRCSWTYIHYAGATPHPVRLVGRSVLVNCKDTRARIRMNEQTPSSRMYIKYTTRQLSNAHIQLGRVETTHITPPQDDREIINIGNWK